jgi:hypothetical protein
MIFFISALIFWIICLHFKLTDLRRNYLGETSSLKLKLKEKDKIISRLEENIRYWKRKKEYEEYLKD